MRPHEKEPNKVLSFSGTSDLNFGYHQLPSAIGRSPNPEVPNPEVLKYPTNQKSANLELNILSHRAQMVFPTTDAYMYALRDQ